MIHLGWEQEPQQPQCFSLIPCLRKVFAFPNLSVFQTNNGIMKAVSLSCTVRFCSGVK